MRNKKNYRNILLYIVSACLLGALLLFAVYRTLSRTVARFSSDFYYPFLATAKSAENFTASRAMMSKSKYELVRAIDRLQKENMDLAARAALLFQLQDQNNHLRRTLSMPEQPYYKTVTAEVLMRDPLTWMSSFTINKGSDNGIREGDLVLSMMPLREGGQSITAVVGRIRSVSLHTAVVSTIYSRECSLSVVLPESGSYGVLQGDGTGAHSGTIRYLPLDAKYGVGEVVMTSGFSERSAPGIYIGTLQADRDGVAAHVTERGRLFAEATVKSALNISQIRFVTVLTLEIKP